MTARFYLWAALICALPLSLVPVQSAPSADVKNTVTWPPYGPKLGMLEGIEEGGHFIRFDPFQKQPLKVPHKHGRGRKVDPIKLAKLKAESYRLHHLKLKALPRTTAATFDCVSMGWVPPIVDQGQCGSCWDFSGTGMCVSAFMKSQGTNAPGPLSEQYTLDCYQNGGCDGDDNTTVLIHAKSVGLPTTVDYGPYTASVGQCKAGVKLYQITDWGFVDGGQGQGVTDTQKIKDAMVAYGPIGCAVAAGGTDFWNNGTGIDTGNSDQIDHDVILVGWDDAKSWKREVITIDAVTGKQSSTFQTGQGCWKMRNSWGTTWGNQGYAWVAYGADQIGTEAVWCTVAGNSPIPPNPPLLTGTPPFKLYEGQAPSFTQVGTVTGYPDIASAEADAKTIANKDATSVLIYDASKPSVLVETVQPSAPMPAGKVTVTLTAEQVASVLAQAKCKKGFAWLTLLVDVEKIAADIANDLPTLQSDIQQLLIDLGMPAQKAKKLQLAK